MIVLFAMIAAAADMDVRSAAAAAPQAVRALIERRAGCNHWTGEEPYDEPRRREIERAVRDLRCDTLDMDERKLRKRYARHPGVLRLIERTRDADGAL